MFLLTTNYVFTRLLGTSMVHLNSDITPNVFPEECAVSRQRSPDFKSTV